MSPGEFHSTIFNYMQNHMAEQENGWLHKGNTKGWYQEEEKQRLGNQADSQQSRHTFDCGRQGAGWQQVHKGLLSEERMMWELLPDFVTETWAKSAAGRGLGTSVCWVPSWG